MPRIIEGRWMGVGYDVIVEHLPVADDHGRPIHDAHGLPRTEEHTTLVFIIQEPGVQRVVRIPFRQDAEQLNFLTLPVADKLWNATQDNKGGFIQEAFEWKPAAYQTSFDPWAMARRAGLM